MFSTSLATMHFHFILALKLLFHVDPNCWTISSSYYYGGLPSWLFLVSWIPLDNCCLWTLRRVWPSRTSIFRIPRLHPSLRSRINSFQMCSCNDITSKDLSIALFLFYLKQINMYFTSFIFNNHYLSFGLKCYFLIFISFFLLNFSFKVFISYFLNNQLLAGDISFVLFCFVLFVRCLMAYQPSWII